MNRKSIKSIIFLLACVLVAAFLIFYFVIRGPKNTANGDGNATGKDNNTMSGEQNTMERDNKTISGDNARTGNGNLGDTQVSNSINRGTNVGINIYNNPSSEPSDAKTSSENSSISESSPHSESSDAKTSNENSSISESSQYQEQPEPNESSQVAETKPVYLADLNPLNYQKHDENGWHDDYYLSDWEPEKDEGADGNKYPKGVLMCVRGSYYTDKIRIEYYLNNEYSSLSGKFMLTNGTKSTGVTGKFSILGTSDDGESRHLYPENQEYIDITGGFPPEPFEIDVNGMEKLTFLVEGEERLDGKLAILLADPILYK